MNEADVKRRLDELNLATAELNHDEALERAQQRKTDKAERSRRNKQRQGQLRQDIADRQTAIKSCSHRQGGSVKNPRKGKGPSALKAIVLPDDGRRLIMCANCPLRVFSPPVADGFKRPRQGESREAAGQRVERYQQELEEFERLWEITQDQLTEEAAQPMHCGTTFEFVDGDGQKAYVPGPCDRYAQGRDNRKKRAA